jgi:hypothetical protein
MINLRERGSDKDTSWMDVDVSSRGVWLRPASWVSETSGIEYRVFAWAGTEEGLEIPPAADPARGWAGPAVFLPISEVYDYLAANGHDGPVSDMVSDITYAARKAERTSPWATINKPKLLKLLNAFSANMLAEFPSSVTFTEILVHEAANLARNAESAVGHADTAAVFAAVLGVPVECRRVSVELHPGDSAVIGQYRGPRLPEGATTLPEGAEIKWLLCKIAA